MIGQIVKHKNDYSSTKKRVNTIS